jgi:hypothetical protein
MKRKKPSFNEGYYGFRTFSHLLEDAQKRGIVKLRRDQRSGSYIVEDLGEAAPTDAGAASTATPSTGSGATAEVSVTAEAEAAKPSTRRRRSRGGRRTKAPTAAGDGDTDAGTADNGADDSVPAPTGPAGPSESETTAAAAGQPDRGSGFSLFSWLRRDPENESTEADKKP